MMNEKGLSRKHDKGRGRERSKEVQQKSPTETTKNRRYFTQVKDRMGGGRSE